MSSSYRFDSLVPAWLAHDGGYTAALGQYLSTCMAQLGYRLIELPRVTETSSAASLPVGMRLVRAECVVEEFDIDVDDDVTPYPSPNGRVRFRLDGAAGA
jgi:hypothetical protein